MWSYDKRLQFPVKIKNPDPQTAGCYLLSIHSIVSQNGRFCDQK